MDDPGLACLRLRGLPFAVTRDVLLEFFNDYTVRDLLLACTDGKPNGQAFVILPKAEAAKAQLELNNRYIGKRFIEIFSSTIADMEAARRLCAEQPKQPSSSSTGSQRSKQNSASNLHIIRLRGLPFSATAADIKAFLAPVELPDGINSIQMVRHPDMRPTGEAYVHLSTETEVMQALNKHKQLMGKRYIEVFISCVAELQQSMAPPRPISYQQADQGYAQANSMPRFAGAGVMLGPQCVPAGNPAAQAAWLQRQQQLTQLQQQVQLQAAAQQKMMANLQRQQQAVNLRVQAQLQAHVQALPHVYEQLQLSDISSGNQQDSLGAAQAMPGRQSPHQQQHVLAFNGLNAPGRALSPAAVMQTARIVSPAASTMARTVSASGSSSLSSNMGSAMSGYHTGCGMASAPTIGGLTPSAASAATAMCSPSPLDVQYVPFFCSGNAAPMATALMLQEAHGLQPGSLQMFSPSGSFVNNPVSHAQQQSLFATELLSSSANAVDSTAMGTAGVIAGPDAFCSDPFLQGMGSGPLAGGFVNSYLRGLDRADVPGSAQEWLS